MKLLSDGQKRYRKLKRRKIQQKAHATKMLREARRGIPCYAARVKWEDVRVETLIEDLERVESQHREDQDNALSD